MGKKTKAARTQKAKAPAPKEAKRATKAAPKTKAAAKKDAPTRDAKRAPARSSAVGSQTLICEIDHNDDNLNAKLTWRLEGDPRRPWSFSVKRETLREQTEDLRSALKTLEAITADFGASPQSYASALRRLAREGARLADLVVGGNATAGTEKSAKVFYDWFAQEVAPSKRGRYEIVITYVNLDTELPDALAEESDPWADTAPTKMHVAPWHLAFSLPKGQKIENLPPTKQAFAGFWCAQFRLAVVTMGHRGADAKHPSKLDADKTTIAVALELDARRTRGMSEDYVKPPRKTGEDKETLVLDTAAKFKTHRERHENENRFYYVLLQREGGGYTLGDGQIDRNDIIRAGNSEKEGPVIISMFDGDCIMRDRTDWIEPLIMRLRGGLIAAETDIATPVYRLWGWGFLRDTIAQSQPLALAIENARDKHWPRSLLYGFYCNARKVYIDPPEDMAESFEDIEKFIREQAEGMK